MGKGCEQAVDRDSGQILVVVPRLDDGRIILLRRGGLAEGGLWGLPTCPLPVHQDLRETAVALLHRTTDYVPESLAQLGSFHSLPISADRSASEAARAHCYLAEGLRPSTLLPYHAGRAMTTALPLAEVRQMIQRGLIRCGTLLSALTLLSAAEQAPAQRAGA